MKYFLITYGCQMNKSDSERIAAGLEKNGYEPASKIDEANLVVVNMCSVRQSAVDRIYGLIPKIKNKKNILTGCILKKDRKRFAQYFDEIIDIKNLTKQVKPKYSNKFSAFVPIMTGCNNFCAYCVVPYTRGREVSRPAEEIICEVKNLIKRGVKEIWLLGQNVNSYRGPIKIIKKTIKLTPKTGDRLNCESSFPQLLRKINDIPGKFWIRFISPHPKDFSDELIEAMANCKKVTEYLNLPVQAGDDEVLKRMNRPYTVAQYKNLVKKIRKKIPNIVLSTDVIVGFPGETKKQFENSLKLFKKIKYDMAYIAKYSPRAGTAATKLKDNVPQKEKDRRKKILTEILKQIALANNKKYIGKIVEALIMKHETCNMKHFYIGKTRTYKTVKFQVLSFKLQDIIGKFVKVKITNALPWGLKGELI